MTSYHFHDDNGETYSEQELEQLYRDMLDEVYDTVKIAGLEYETSRALEALDPVAFRCGFADFAGDYQECFDTEGCADVA